MTLLWLCPILTKATYFENTNIPKLGEHNKRQTSETRELWESCFYKGERRMERGFRWETFFEAGFSSSRNHPLFGNE